MTLITDLKKIEGKKECWGEAGVYWKPGQVTVESETYYFIKLKFMLNLKNKNERRLIE